MYVHVCNVMLYLCVHTEGFVGFFSPSSFMAPCRLYDISVALQELKNVAYFPENPPSDSCCSHGKRDHDSIPEALIILCSRFLIPARAVIVPFLFPESTFGAAY